MSLFSRFKIAEEVDKSKAVERLIVGSTPDFDFFFLVTLAVLMATLGLVLNSAAVVIGSMLIAPILYPILSLAVSVVMSDYKLFYRSLFTLGKAIFLAVGLSFAAAILMPGSIEMTTELMNRTEPSLAYFVIALISGLAVSYSLVQPGLNETFPGIVVSVALLPPLATVGVGLALFDWMVVTGSLALFAVNVVGILFASLISFSLMDLSTKKQLATATLVKEEKRIAEEQKTIKELDGKNETQTNEQHEG